MATTTKATDTILKDLIETLEDGCKGFTSAAEKLTSSDKPQWAQSMQGFADQRRMFADELRRAAGTAGIVVDEDGSMLGALHRGWMAIRDAVAGDDPHGVLDAAEQGEDHAKKEYREALEQNELPIDIRAIVQRQYNEILKAHDAVKALRDSTG